MKRRSDKERLDWLSRRTTVEKFYSSQDTPFEEQITRLFAFEQRGNHGTLRQAIDAAMSAERKAGRP